MTKAFAKKECLKEVNHEIKEKTCGCCSKTPKTDTKPCCKGKDHHTEIIVEYDVGFGNTMFIRGCCCKNLSWDNGVAMKNIGGNIWTWTTDCKCSPIEFKLLINDNQWCTGENIFVEGGKINQVIVTF